MKYCSHCGAELFDEAVICPKCGCSVGTTNSQMAAHVKTREEKQAIAGLVLGIVGLVFGFDGGLIGLVCSILGIIFSVKARKAGIVNGKTMAGLVCGIIGLCLTVVFFILGLLVFPTLVAIIIEMVEEIASAAGTI